MDILFQILSVFILGVIGGANPGPVLTASFTEALRKGFIKSLPVVFMAMVAESIIAIFILTLFFSTHIPEAFFYAISFIGAGVLIWLAVQIWKIRELGGEGEVFSFKKIFLLTIFNGPFWIFWIAICLPQAFLLKEQIVGGQVLFVIIFEFGWLLATIFLTFLFSRFRPFLAKSNFIPIVFKVFSLILLFFALRLSATSISYFY